MVTHSRGATVTRMNCKMWCSVVVTVVIVVAAAHGGAVREVRQARQCSVGEECVSLRVCRPLQDLVARREPGAQQKVKDAICGSGAGRDFKVCCPDSGSDSGSRPTFPSSGGGGRGENLLPKENECGQSSGVRVVFGEDAPLNAYPWMALLGYKDKVEPEWNCGGVLINDRYVLTAAHCVHRNFTTMAGTGDVVTVRLGEHNTAKNPDCPKSSAASLPCNPTPQDFAPEVVTMHETFNLRAAVSDDIALIRLDRKATMGASVQPVCLPPAGLDVKSFLGSRDGVVAGWGATETKLNSDVLQAARVPFASKTVCEPRYPGQLVEEQVCFGGRGRMDSCFGDSGGPVFQTDSRLPRSTVLGLVSRGLSVCGLEGAPAVYTNVAFYRKWITDNIKP